MGDTLARCWSCGTSTSCAIGQHPECCRWKSARSLLTKDVRLSAKPCWTSRLTETRCLET
eukprot:5466201-Amphidinium_carterae.2